MSNKVVLVLDCGATNIRTVAVDSTGRLVAKVSVANTTRPDPNYPDYKIWDIEEIWDKFVNTTREVMSKLEDAEVAGVTVTTFGVDGAPVSDDGKLLYPIISWACQRTASVMDNIEKYISFNELYAINGINRFSFNTINKLIWYRENKPEILDHCKYYVFISNLLSHRLSGEWATDVTMAGTSMLTDLKARNFSRRIMRTIGCSSDKFPPLAEPGTIIGKVTAASAKLTGIPAGTPVVSCGHDTQFAVFGSGAEQNQPVLSSGTWEILMARTTDAKTNEYASSHGVTTELDPIPGLYNVGVQWLGSGILEWIKNMFYAHEAATLSPPDLYALMAAEAEKADVEKVALHIDFLNQYGSITGLGINTRREQVYLAALHALSQKTKMSLEILEATGNFKAKSILLVGGGSKNKLWNRLREETLGIPVNIVDCEETTVLGAALFTFAGVGVYASANEARIAMSSNQHRD